MKKIFLLLPIVHLSLLTAAEPIVISIGVINNIGNSVTEIQQHEFQTNLEKYLQSYSGYIQIINPDYDASIVSAFKRILSGPTQKDINTIGQLRNQDKIIVLNIYSKKLSIVKKIYKCDARLIDITSGVLQTFEYEDQDYIQLAKKLANGIYEYLWVGVLNIETNLKNYTVIIDDKKVKVTNNKYSRKFTKGKYSIKIEKNEYRPVIDKIEILAGRKIEKFYNLIKQGSKIEIEGRPFGAKVQIVKDDNVLISDSLPFNQLISKGQYKVVVSSPGYQSQS